MVIENEIGVNGNCSALHHVISDDEGRRDVQQRSEPDRGEAVDPAPYRLAGFGAAVPEATGMGGSLFGFTPDSEPLRVAGRMGHEERELLMRWLIRSEVLFAKARPVLTPQHFSDPYEIIWAVAWQAACDVHDQLGRLPDEAVLTADVMSRVHDFPAEFPGGAADELLRFVQEACAFSPPDDWAGHARDLLKRFLLERHVIDPVRRFFEGLDGVMPRDPVGFVSEVQQQVEQAVATDDTFRVYDPDELDAATFSREWLVPGVLVAGQPAIMAGPAKALKTSIAAELAVSIGLGTTQLFDHFQLAAPRRNVGFICGESGEATLRDLLRRISHSRGSSLAACNVFTCFRLPKVQSELAVLTAMIRRHAWEVLILDPLYLSLLAGERDPDAAAKLHKVGPLLADLCGACLALGCTPVLVHHTTKHLAGRKGAECYEPLELTDVHGACVVEFARQWILINRREPFEPNGEVEKVWLKVGGSAGHSGLWALDVDQGRFEPATGSRPRWRTRVLDAEAARSRAAERREEARAEADAPERVRIVRAIVECLRGGPRTRTATARDIGMGKDSRLFTETFTRLEREGIIAPTGERHRGGELYGLERDPDQPNPERRQG